MCCLQRLFYTWRGLFTSETSHHFCTCLQKVCCWLVVHWFTTSCYLLCVRHMMRMRIPSTCLQKVCCWMVVIIPWSSMISIMLFTWKLEEEKVIKKESHFSLRLHQCLCHKYCLNPHWAQAYENHTIHRLPVYTLTSWMFITSQVQSSLTLGQFISSQYIHSLYYLSGTKFTDPLLSESNNHIHSPVMCVHVHLSADWVSRCLQQVDSHSMHVHVRIIPTYIIDCIALTAIQSMLICIMPLAQVEDS